MATPAEVACLLTAAPRAAAICARGLLILPARIPFGDALSQQAFQQIDVDGSGFVSRENLCTVMGETCSNGNCDALVDELLEDADSNNDGKISYEEFLALYRTKQLSEGREEVLNATGKGGCQGKTCC